MITAHTSKSKQGRAAILTSSQNNTTRVRHLHPGIYGCERTGSDKASDKRQNCRLSLALSLENLGVRTGSVRACDK